MSEAQMSTELKPCPICGAQAEQTYRSGYAIARCTNPACNAQTGFWATHTQTAAAWNTRAACPECAELQTALGVNDLAAALAKVRALQKVAEAARKAMGSVTAWGVNTLVTIRPLKPALDALAALDAPESKGGGK